MRRRLLLLCFTLSLCTSSFAIDSGNYLVRNVATGKYWGSANSWGTQASLVDNPEYVTWTQLDDGKFHLESQVNNGEAAYYFNGDFMDNDTPVALTIEQRANGYYTISNGEIYYGYDGSSTVLGKTETDPTAANVQWEIISVADATAALGQATQTAPMNATFLIADPNFGRNNRHYNAWTFEASNKNNSGDVTNFCVESWHATFTMSQTVTVPNGVYGLTAQGFYAQDGSDENHLPVFFLNDATQTFPVRQGTENSMALASASFSQGLYATQPIFVNVTDGTLTLGARLEGNTQLWCIWDNFTLLYYGTAADLQQMTFDVRFNKKVAEVNSLLVTEDVSTEGRRQLNEALAAFNTINANSAESAQQSVEQQIDAAVAYAKDGLALVGQLAACYNKYGERVGTAGSSDQTLTGTLAAIISAISGHTYESNAQIEEWIETLTTARKQYFPYEYRYWFDNDERTEHTDLSNTPKWSFDADISNLKETLHTLHFQVSDEEGTLSVPVTRFFVKTINPTANYGRYWFDDAIDQMQTSTQMQGAFDIDVSQLPEGFHILHYQVVGTNGNVSGVVTRQFYKLYMPTMSSWHCWFDNDFSTLVTGTDFGKTILLDVSSLVDGYHVLHIQADGGKGVASTPITRPFIKTPQVVGVDHLTCLCMIDDQLYKQEQVSANGGVVEWKFDVSSLSQGFHRVFIQVVTPSGAATSAYQSFFMRETTSAEFAQMKCVYAIDGAEFYTEAGQVDDGTYHFDLDVSSLDDGLHRITYMLSNGFGVSTKAQTQFFMKTPLGGNGITEYWYWLNDQADSNATKVKLPERQDPFSLISLLPVESQPLRSSLFQFRIEQDKPVIYAKNDIHIRFYDAAGRFTDASKQFVDESVKQEVTDVTLLNPGEHKTSARPADNEVKWYKVEALRGDSLAFKTDYPCSVQLFSPSGEELYAVSGPEAVKYGGSYASEDGTYYLALHDVTAQNCHNLSVDYLHIDKYAVLSYTPKRIGVAPSSFTMQLDGNGFDKLQEARLEKGGISMKPDTVVALSKSLASLHFVLSGEEDYGSYDLILTFKDGEAVDVLKLSNVLGMEEAVYGEIAAMVSSKRVLASPYPVTVTIKNTGNVPQTLIPFFIAYDNADHIQEVQFNNFNVIVEKELTEAGFKIDNHTDNLLGKGVKGRFFSLMIPELGPYEEIEYELGFIAGGHTRFNMYAWTDRAWSLRTKQLARNATFAKSHRAPQSTACMPDPCEILGTIVDNASCSCNLVMANIEALANLYAALQMRANMESIRAAGYSSYWEAKEALGIEMDMFERRRLRNPHDILWRLAENCGSDNLTHFMSIWHELQNHDSEDDCPDPDPHPIEILNPGDPNDIFGYVAESGSKYMKEGTTDVYYTIEFENDPEIATASAHTIVVRDTLDTSRFDLSTFAATGVKIGEKEMKLNGEKNFSKKTMDLRPEIDVIAQVSLSFDEQKGIATWTIESLDPMSMEPTMDAMQGVLPVNVNGNGQGELTFDIKLKPGMVEGESVSNRAAIVFDQEGVIMTPVWTNIVDATLPESSIADVAMVSDSTAKVMIEASDEMSKPWKYDLYVQEKADGVWKLVAANMPIDSVAAIEVEESVSYGFYVVVTDSAGNVEQKEAAREFTFEVFGSQMDTNTKIELAQGWNWVSHNQQEPLAIEALKPASARMVGQTEELIDDSRFGWMGDLEELLPTQMYKLQMDAPLSVQLSGRLFNAGFRSVPLYAGWNWLGYPVANTMAPAEALSKLDAEEGDMLIGQDGLATYSDGQWTGTLLEMVPGQGYMFRSASNKNLFYNATAHASSRRVDTQSSVVSSQLPEDWKVDKRKYPNVMGVIAVLMQNSSVVEPGEWTIGAFCGTECRGISAEVNGTLMMNVYGQGGESIRFYAMNRETGEVLPVVESEPFGTNVLGAMRQPYLLHIGEATGVRNSSPILPEGDVYDLQGRKVADGRSMPDDRLSKGIYVATDKNRSKTQKVIRR